MNFNNVELVGYDKIEADYLNLTIPFLSPPNCEWPEYLKNLGTFGNLRRTQNMEQLDAEAQLVLSAEHLTVEMKNYSRKISSTDMKEILETSQKILWFT